MAEENNNPVFQIQRMYLKDLSLEIPHAPHIFLEQAQPTVEVAIDNSHEQLADGIHEVTVTVTVTTRIDNDRVVFLVEGKQAGIFEIRNIPEDQMDIVLNIVCPNTVYPYLRSNIADVIQRAGFPPIHLAEINFEVLYQQRLAAAQLPPTTRTRRVPRTEHGAQEPAGGRDLRVTIRLVPRPHGAAHRWLDGHWPHSSRPEPAWLDDTPAGAGR